jgi:hypothetical protein
MIPLEFPLQAPFRVDQVTPAPLLLAGLFVAQGLAAIFIHWAGASRRPRLWMGGVGLLLTLTLVFFTLASWGNSDTTRFSHMMQWDTSKAPPEPLWVVLRPLILLLPYRMSAVHGLVATAFGGMAVLLAARWRAWAWAGWWSLLITCSPLLRGFLQNAHTRQALATLLLVPLLLAAAGLARPPRWSVGGGLVLSALSHNTFVWNLPLSLLPALSRLLLALPSRLAGLRRGLAGAGPGAWGAAVRRHWPWLLLALTVAGLLAVIVPVALERFQDYAGDAYFSSYAVRRIIGRLQRALALGLLLAVIQKRLNPLRLLTCPITLSLLLFGSLYAALQVSIGHGWIPQITSRLADGVALYLLLLYLAWLDRYKAHWYILPALYVTLQYWLEGRILDYEDLDCGRNDEFLCVPDRWPWQVRY